MTTISVYCDDEDRQVVLRPLAILLVIHVDDSSRTRYEWTCPRCKHRYCKTLDDIDMANELVDAGVDVRFIEWHPESFDVNSAPLNNDDLLDLMNELKAL